MSTPPRPDPVPRPPLRPAAPPGPAPRKIVCNCARCLEFKRRYDYLRAHPEIEGLGKAIGQLNSCAFDDPEQQAAVNKATRILEAVLREVE